MFVVATAIPKLRLRPPPLPSSHSAETFPGSRRHPRGRNLRTLTGGVAAAAAGARAFPDAVRANTDVPRTRRGGRRTESASAAPATRHTPPAPSIIRRFFFFFFCVYPVALSLSLPSFVSAAAAHNNYYYYETRATPRLFLFLFGAFFIFLSPGAFLSAPNSGLRLVVSRAT